MPAHGRLKLARACMRQLRRTCDALLAGGIEASAIVVANDENLDTARALEFGTIERDNFALGVKFNDAYQLACDPAFNPHPADFVVPIGSDDFVDAELLLSAPTQENALTCFKLASFVREDGKMIAPIKINYAGGLGVRIVPRALVAALGYRPAPEHISRGVDGRTLRRFDALPGKLELIYHDQHDCQIVDFKTRGGQLNTYIDCMRHSLTRLELDSPWEVLSQHYPREALDEVRRCYS